MHLPLFNEETKTLLDIDNIVVISSYNTETINNNAFMSCINMFDKDDYVIFYYDRHMYSRQSPTITKIKSENNVKVYDNYILNNSQTDMIYPLIKYDGGISGFIYKFRTKEQMILFKTINPNIQSFSELL